MNSPNPCEPLSLPSLADESRECPEHGAYVVKRLEMFGKIIETNKCPGCADRGKAEREARERQEQVVQREHRVRSILGRSGIPARFEDRTFANYAAKVAGQKVALASCRNFADAWTEQFERGGSLVLTGGPGTGKTHLACAIASHIARNHLAVPWFGTVTQMLRHIKDTYRKDSERSEQDAIDDLIEPDLLIVDEIGVQTGSDHEKMLLFEVLNERYQALKPTILISNLSAQDLEGYIGQRIMDRFRECGTVLAFNWTSHRGQAAT